MGPRPLPVNGRRRVSSDSSVRILPLDEMGCDAGLGVEAGEKSKGFLPSL